MSTHTAPFSISSLIRTENKATTSPSGVLEAEVTSVLTDDHQKVKETFPVTPHESLVSFRRYFHPERSHVSKPYMHPWKDAHTTGSVIPPETPAHSSTPAQDGSNEETQAPTLHAVSPVSPSEHDTKCPVGQVEVPDTTLLTSDHKDLPRCREEDDKLSVATVVGSCSSPHKPSSSQTCDPPSSESQCPNTVHHPDSRTTSRNSRDITDVPRHKSEHVNSHDNVGAPHHTSTVLIPQDCVREPEQESRHFPHQTNSQMSCQGGDHMPVNRYGFSGQHVIHAKQSMYVPKVEIGCVSSAKGHPQTSSTETSALTPSQVPSRPKRNRIIFTMHQTQAMEKLFMLDQYPDIQTYEKLSLDIGIPQKNIKTWFQNKRARQKKHKAARSVMPVHKARSYPQSYSMMPVGTHYQPAMSGAVLPSSTRLPSSMMSPPATPSPPPTTHPNYSFTSPKTSVCQTNPYTYLSSTYLSRPVSQSFSRDHFQSSLRSQAPDPLHSFPQPHPAFLPWGTERKPYPPLSKDLAALSPLCPATLSALEKLCSTLPFNHADFAPERLSFE